MMLYRVSVKRSVNGLYERVKELGKEKLQEKSGGAEKVEHSQEPDKRLKKDRGAKDW